MIVSTRNYIYELRQGGAIVATGHLARETPFKVGERVRFDERAGIVQSVVPTLEPGVERVVIQLLRGG